MRKGDYCANADGVIFGLVERGELPLSALGEAHRGVCVSANHTPHCLARYHRRLFKLSAASIRRFLHVNTTAEVDLVMLGRALKKTHRETGFWLRALYEHVHRVPTLRQWTLKLVQAPRIRIAVYYFAALTGTVGAPSGDLLWKRAEDFRLYPDAQWYLHHLTGQPQLHACYGSDTLKKMVAAAVHRALAPHLPPELINAILRLVY